MAPRKEEAESKVLAIAIMRDGKVVGKLIPGSEPVRLGTGYNNNVVVEGPELPESMVFIVAGEEPDTWILRLSRTMDTVIESADGTTLKFADLRELGIFPVDSNGYYLLNIKYGDQGQVHVGPFLIHFGFIAPPKQEKPVPETRAEKKAQQQVQPPPEEEKPDPRVLKIIVEDPSSERIEMYPSAGLMTVGEADYNTVSIKGIGLPRIHTLLEPEGNRYMLKLIPGIKGGVEVKGSVIPFDTLIQRHLMTQEKPGDPHIWVFDKNVSGVFTMGSVEVFFSFAEPPVEKTVVVEEVAKAAYVAAEYDWDNFAARPHDGLAMKGNRAESNRISIILGLGLAFALITGAVFDRFVTVVRETKEQMLRRAPSARVATLAHQPQEVEGIGEEIIADMTGEETVEVAEGGGGGGAGGPAESGGVSDGEAAGEAVLQSIGFAAYGTGGTGANAGVASDLQSAASSGVGLASGGGGDALIAGASGGGSGGIDGLLGSGGGGLASTIEGVSSSEVEAVHQAAEVSFSTHSSSSQIGVQGRTMNDIRRKINMINMRVKRAYEDLLRNDPTAGGTINVSFSITPDGSVTGVSVSAPGSLSSLSSAVTAAVQTLNFGPSSEQTENIPMSVPMVLVPPE